MAAAMMTPSTQRFLMPTRPRFRYRMSHLFGQRSLSYVCECGKNWKLQNEPKESLLSCPCGRKIIYRGGVAYGTRKRT
jgi:hypothetical protein